jgi:hypothetical protein
MKFLVTIFVALAVCVAPGILKKNLIFFITEMIVSSEDGASDYL